MDQVLLATHRKDVATYREWAEQLGVGLELQAFTNPKTLAGNWREVLAEHKAQLRGFQGLLGLHGAFYDMVSASIDPDIVDITRQRYRQNLHIAIELEADYIVFHVNYMGILKLPNYRPGWHKRQVDFWGAFAEEAAASGVCMILENMWEDDPTIITDILAEVNDPHLAGCLDIAHATLFSPPDLSITHWIDVFAPYLYSCHINNHDGELDQHWPLCKGVIDYGPVLDHLRRLPTRPYLTLEMPCLDYLKASLSYLGLNPVVV